jgi:GH35 family endo-1,4-beta-xylanase
MNANDYFHRQSDITLKLEYQDRTPVVNREVVIEQIRQEFLFGIGGFDAVEYAGGNPDGSPLSPERSIFLQERLDTLFELFNYATLPFYLARYEPVEGMPDEARVMAAAKYFKNRGVVTKGHPLCWHTACADWLMQYGNDEILKKQIARIERDVAAYKGIVDNWDVINEVVIMPIYDKYDNAITRVCRELGRVGMISEVFDAARRANSGATLLLNDFNTSIDYEILIDGCLSAGVPIDVIGVQSHQHRGYWGLEKTLEVLERFTSFGLPVHFTENTILSGDPITEDGDIAFYKRDVWPSTPEGEDRQTREILEFYETLYCDPLVEAITTWDATDGKWLNAPSGILRADNSKKPVYDALMKKIKGDWRTPTQKLNTGADGKLDFTGFRGLFELTCNDSKARFTLDGMNDEILIKI